MRRVGDIRWRPEGPYFTDEEKKMAPTSARNGEGRVPHHTLGRSESVALHCLTARM